MFARMFSAILFTAAVAAGILALRQERLELMHEMVALHGEMDRARQETWDLQVQIASEVAYLLDDQKMQQALGDAELKLEPVAEPVPSDLVRPSMVAEAEHGPR
ncbi:MAG: hypothetical protein ACOCTI_00250 [Phycisphaeraceae bacterium]